MALEKEDSSFFNVSELSVYVREKTATEIVVTP